MDNKKSQREIYINRRKSIDINIKKDLDTQIFEKVITTKEYIDSKQILTYISVGFEVDTIKLINHALANNKEVFAPIVTSEKRVMEFHKITSLDDLVLSKFKVLEPKKSVTWQNFNDTLCIVPGLVFDSNGFRIGYGGGYYDYFLGNNNVKTLGVIYDDFIIDKVITDEFDKNVDKIVTNSRIIF